MTEYVHPVLPPKGKLQAWEDLFFSSEENLDVLLIKVYQAGADYELTECCSFIKESKWFVTPEFRINQIMESRRPKPPSLKEEALSAVHTAVKNGSLSVEVGDVILDALDLIKEE